MEYFELRRAEVLLGTLQVVDVDQPWVICTFAPTNAFDEFRPLFDHELELIEGSDNLDAETWEEAYSHIDELGLQLVPVSGATPITEFLLHIEGSEARFRY
jgi:hypothetical protein